MKLSREQTRQIGAVIGLITGWGMMYAMGYRGVIPAAVFGMTGCVSCAIVAEKYYDRQAGENQ